MPDASGPEMHQALADMPFPLRLSVRYIAMSPETALRFLKTQWRRWFSLRKGIVRVIMESFFPGPSRDDPVALARADEAEAAREAVANGQLGYGYLTVAVAVWDADRALARSEEHTSELQSLMRISYAVFCLKKKKKNNRHR